MTGRSLTVISNSWWVWAPTKMNCYNSKKKNSRETAEMKRKKTTAQSSPTAVRIRIGKKTMHHHTLFVRLLVWLLDLGEVRWSLLCTHSFIIFPFRNKPDQTEVPASAHAHGGLKRKERRRTKATKPVWAGRGANAPASPGMAGKLRVSGSGTGRPPSPFSYPHHKLFLDLVLSYRFLPIASPAGY